MKISECIRKYRKLNKLTQKQLGTSIGKTAGAIRKYEAGIRTPSLETILVIAAVLKVEPTELFGDDKELRYVYLAFINSNKSNESVVNDLLKQKISDNKKGLDVALLAFEILYEYVNGISILEQPTNEVEVSFERICKFIRIEENIKK
jgi:transcriptional regulator with XRE-family HTH domain